MTDENSLHHGSPVFWENFSGKRPATLPLMRERDAYTDKDHCL